MGIVEYGCRNMHIVCFCILFWYVLGHFSTSSRRPKGYCFCLHSSVCQSICSSVCLSVHLYDQDCPCNNSKIIFHFFLNLAGIFLGEYLTQNDWYCSLLKMHTIDPKVTLTFFKFLKSFFKLKLWNSIYVGLSQDYSMQVMGLMEVKYLCFWWIFKILA